MPSLWWPLLLWSPLLSALIVSLSYLHLPFLALCSYLSHQGVYEVTRLWESLMCVLVATTREWSVDHSFFWQVWNSSRTKRRKETLESLRRHVNQFHRESTEQRSSTWLCLSSVPSFSLLMFFPVHLWLLPLISSQNIVTAYKPRGRKKALHK